MCSLAIPYLLMLQKTDRVAPPSRIKLIMSYVVAALSTVSHQYGGDSAELPWKLLLDALM